MEGALQRPVLLLRCATALGLIANPDPLPWNSRIAVGASYRAAVETLTKAMGTGVVDLL